MFDRMIRFSQSIQIKRAYLKALILFLTLFDIDMMDGCFPKSEINFGNHQDLIIDCLYYNLIIETNSEQPKDLDGVLDQKDSCSTVYLVFLYTFEQHFGENNFVTGLVSFFYRFKKMLSLNILNIQKMETILLRQINMNCHQMIGKRNKNTQQRQKLTSTEEIRKSQQNIDYISHNQDCNYKPMDEAPTTLCENIKNELVKLRQKLNEIIGYRFEDICKLCKKISKQLTNWLRYYPTIKSNSQLDQIFDDCIGNLNILVRSTSVSTSNFPFPYFGFILKKAFKKINKLISCNQITINLRVQKNEQSFNKNTIDIKPIEKGQLIFLKSENVNQTIQQITKNQIILPNNQCALCSQVFVQGFQIFNHNPLFPVVLGLTQKQGFDKIQMYKYLCSVSNMGGGLIIIGVQRRKNSVYATGINVKDENSMHEKIKQIRQVASSHIRPQFYFDVSVVRVHSNFFDRQNLYQEKNRYCLKIIIYLAQSNFASFVEISNKGFHSLYQSYVLDGHKSRRILPESNNFSFYKYMLKKYKHIKENPANCHQGIKCSYPYNFYSKKFQMYWNSLTEEQIYSLEYTPQIQEPIVQESDELKFKYTYNSILAVGSKNKDRYVRDFEDYANSKKLNIELFKPFSKYFKEGQRSIWMLSHTDKHQVIKSVIKQIDKQGNITFIPVYKTLQIDRSKINQQYYDYIQKSFMQKYPEGFKIQSKFVTYQGKQREVLFFDFNCYPHAIFGYLIFQSLQLKPYFVKPNTEYKKKTGKKW